MCAASDNVVHGGTKGQKKNEAFNRHGIWVIYPQLMGGKTQGGGSARDAEAGSPVSCGPRLRARAVESHGEWTQTRLSKCMRVCTGILTGTRTGPGSCWLVHLCTTFDISGKPKFEIHCFHLILSLEQTQSPLSLPLESRGRARGWWAGGVGLQAASLHALPQDAHSPAPAPWHETGCPTSY